jgi:hypothetical protein
MKKFHWIPRILSILAILFISLFAADSFDTNLTWWQQVSGFILHLVPSFILALVLIIAWNKELLGGIIFIVIGFIFTPIVFSMNYRGNHSIGISLSVIAAVTFPFIVVGVLFLISHYSKRKELNKNS